jgi:TATA-box binding protein (TBP) (component of TFIID and TFIIIB)
MRAGTVIDLDGIYSRFCECTTYQRSVFPGLVLRPPQSPIVLLIFTSGRIVCTGGKSYSDIQTGFDTIFRTLKSFVHTAPSVLPEVEEASGGRRKRRKGAVHG